MRDMAADKEIIVAESNKDKIEAIIKEAEGKASARTIGYDDITKAIAKVEEELNGIPKKYLEDTVVECDPWAQKLPSAYKYRAESTQFVITFRKGKWRVSNIRRYYLNQCAGTCRIQAPTDLLMEGLKAKMALF